MSMQGSLKCATLPRMIPYRSANSPPPVCLLRPERGEKPGTAVPLANVDVLRLGADHRALLYPETIDSLAHQVTLLLVAEVAEVEVGAQLRQNASEQAEVRSALVGAY